MDLSGIYDINNCEGIGYSYKTSSSNDLQSARIFPNPSDGNFNLTYPILGRSDIVISIDDLSGRNFYRGVLSSELQNFNLNLPDGIYFLSIDSSNSGKEFFKLSIVK